MAPWTVTASARRPTLDSIRVYVHEPLSAQLPSLMAGNAPVSNDEEEPRSGSAASLGKDDGGLKQRACTGRSRQPHADTLGGGRACAQFSHTTDSNDPTTVDFLGSKRGALADEPWFSPALHDQFLNG